MFSTGLNYMAINDWLSSVVTFINGFFCNIVAMIRNDSWVRDIVESPDVSPIIDAIKATALTLCVMFFLIDFFTKTLHLQWVTWENVFLLFIKLIFARILIDKAPEICEMIYSGFSSLVTTALDSIGTDSVRILPGGPIEQYMALGLTNDEATKVVNHPAITFLDFSPMMIQLKAAVFSLLYFIILAVCFVIVVGRLFELVVYTIIAPIPLSTFASDNLHEIGKGFLKSYVAVVIQALVLVIMVITYKALLTHFNSIFNEEFAQIVGWVNILALALGVMQSGNWAKRICGAM